MTDADLEVIPLQWAGGVVEGSTAYLRVEMPQAGADYRVPSSCRLFLNRAKTGLSREMLGLLPRTRVSCFDGRTFRDAGWLAPRRDPVRTAFSARPEIPGEEEYYFFDVRNLSGWTKGRWGDEEPGYWLKFEFDGFPARNAIEDVNDPPFIFNCCTASNLRREHLTLPLDPEGVGFARVGPLVNNELLVRVESVKVGPNDLVPAHDAAIDAPGTFLLDWVPRGRDTVAPDYHVLLRLPLAPGADLSGQRADVSVLLTELDLAPKVPPGTVEQSFLLGMGAGNVTVTNITPSWPGRRAVLTSAGIVDGIGHVVRTGDRLFTRRDFEHVLRRLDSRVQSVSTTVVLEPDEFGALGQILDIQVDVKGWAGPAEWGLKVLAAFYERELEERSAPNLRVRVTCNTDE